MATAGKPKKKTRPRPKLLRRYTDLAATIDILSGQHIVLLDPKSWDDKNDSHFIEKYKTTKRAKSVLALCMSSVGETYHHWRVFCGHSSGVCIEFFQKELLAVVASSSGVRGGPVQYMTLKQINKATLALGDLPFLKRHAFRHEAEYRLIYESMTTEESAHVIKIPLSVVRKIMLSPWLPEALLRATRELLNGIPGCSKIPVERSELTSNEEWKQNADRLITTKP